MGGAVFQEPKRGPTSTSQFELTSIISTAKQLFNLTTFLTKRDAWAAPFGELLEDRLRTDTPMHLPDSPPPAKPWTPPGEEEEDDDDDDNGDDDDDDEESGPDTRSRRLSGNEPQHCSFGNSCRGVIYASTKQLNQVRLLAKLTEREEPRNMEDMSSDDADHWLSKHWQLWR